MELSEVVVKQIVMHLDCVSGCGGMGCEIALFVKGTCSNRCQRRAQNNVEQGKGRFRSFLLGAVKHFLADMGDLGNASKRGGGEEPVPIAASTETSTEIQVPDANHLRPDQEFDRKWAMTVLERALAALAAEDAADAAVGKGRQFEMLKPWLTGDTEHLSQADAALAVGLTEGAVKVAIHRLRRRFRDLAKAEIRQTLSDPSQVANELACLAEALGGE